MQFHFRWWLNPLPLPYGTEIILGEDDGSILVLDEVFEGQTLARLRQTAKSGNGNGFQQSLTLEEVAPVQTMAKDALSSTEFVTGGWEIEFNEVTQISWHFYASNSTRDFFEATLFVSGAEKEFLFPSVDPSMEHAYLRISTRSGSGLLRLNYDFVADYLTAVFIDEDGEKIFFCHSGASGKEVSIDVSKNAAEEHCGHGDLVGQCEQNVYPLAADFPDFMQAILQDEEVFSLLEMMATFGIVQPEFFTLNFIATQVFGVEPRATAFQSLPGVLVKKNCPTNPNICHNLSSLSLCTGCCAAVQTCQCWYGDPGSTLGGCSKSWFKMACYRECLDVNPTERICKSECFQVF